MSLLSRWIQCPGTQTLPLVISQIGLLKLPKDTDLWDQGSGYWSSLATVSWWCIFRLSTPVLATFYKCIGGPIAMEIEIEIYVGQTLPLSVVIKCKKLIASVRVCSVGSTTVCVFRWTIYTLIGTKKNLRPKNLRPVRWGIITRKAWR